MTDNIHQELMKHLIDASSMRADIENLKQSDRDTSQRVLTILGEMSADMKALRQEVVNVPQKISACRADMRDEIERDFPSKTEAMAMEQRIEKQIADTDKTLGRQIDGIDKKLAAGLVEMRTEIANVDTKVDKMWIKITITVAAVTSTIVTIGGVIQWLLLFSQSK